MNQPTLVPTVDLDAQPNTPSLAIAKAMSKGVLRTLTEVERLHYNLALCRSLGLNLLTRLFDYLVDERSGRVSLYLNLAGVTQLRELRGISTRVVSRHTDEESLHYVTCLAEDLVGRKEEATAIVSL
ncbi:MAG: hypothetical protein AAGG02_19820 [Cyanobacteria bacterium P01_H01_bin.15]